MARIDRRKVINFKRKVYPWLKETNEDDRCSKASWKTKGHSSRSSRRSSKSNSLASSKSERIKEKAKLTWLLAREAFLEKRHQVENEAQRLKIQEKRAKARQKLKFLRMFSLVINKNYKKKDWEIVNILFIPDKPKKGILKSRIVDKIVVI